MVRKILITGGAGFIGTNLAFYLMEKYPNDEIVILDKLTYASNQETLEASKVFSSGIKNFYEADIRDAEAVFNIINNEAPDVLFHLAAESHVCRSIEGPEKFISTNILGTFNLLDAWRKLCPEKQFIYVSTDEVFGELPLSLSQPPFNENTPLAPRSPYAASKAAGDLIALSYFHTYGLNVMVTNCSNNYGRYQHEEKLIPASIKRILKGEPVVLYGDGTHIRDWLHVRDHCAALDAVSIGGIPGERYCIGSSNEKTNFQVVQDIYKCIKKIKPNIPNLTITFDHNARPTDDKRYSIDNAKAQLKLDWVPRKAWLPSLQEYVDSVIGEMV